MISSPGRPFITVVSGLPRSGTSLMMQMLAAGGIPVLTDERRPPDSSNPRGYCEFEPVKRLRADHSWLENAQGRAVKIIHLLLAELPTDGRFNYRVVFMNRPLQEVISSQRAMLDGAGKKSAPDQTLTTVYHRQLLEVKQWLAQNGCFRSVDIDYHTVLAEPRQIAHHVNVFVGGKLDVEAMAAAVAPTLCHHRAPEIPA